MRWWLTPLLASSLACGKPVRAPAPEAVAPWLRADPQRCLIHRDLSEGMETMARRCAEAFVRANGYTELPAEDSTRWTREPEDGGPWPRILAARSGTLDAAAATAQCSRRECIVLFRVRRPMLLCAYRAVAMTQVFTRIRLVPGGIRDMRCNERRA
ncbi:MAG TPA: hypothetical protein VFG66_13410 [Gemmatimonadales bacterium]|nr:hypothetical protein [Gemmatimonadales bacterium]